MPYKNIFCNSPWYEIDIFWDGSFGYCCHQAPYRPYSKNKLAQYNIKNMSISEWHKSEPIRNARMAMFSNQQMSECDPCWHQEKYGNTSRRLKSNIKSVIFTKQNFDDSFRQSPNYNTFNYSFNNKGETDVLPIDLHIDLGNHCNLMCKMCIPEASSSIAAQYKKWNMLEDDRLIGDDWTKDSGVWDNFLTQIIEIPNLKNIHFMGGETLISSRFEQLIDVFIKHKMFNICFSFVTNGTLFNKQLLNKLSLFERVGIEISIETLTKHNEYIRQGTDNNTIIKNIKKYIKFANNSSAIDITLRPALSLLSIGYYSTLLNFCLEHKILIKSNHVTEPACLRVELVPENARKLYKQKFNNILLNLQTQTEEIMDYNESDSTNYKLVIEAEINKCINMLKYEQADTRLYYEFTELISKWDKLYKFNAYEYYPEYSHIFNEYGYVIN